MKRPRVNATGRDEVRSQKGSGGSFAPDQMPPKIRGRFVPRTLDMLNSPAWLRLPGVARNCLEGIEVAFMQAGLKNNGEIVCTYDALEERGVRRASINQALRQAVELGFLEITEVGHRAATEVNFPSRYRLTYCAGFGDPPPTDEWQRIKTDKEAAAALRRVEEARAKEREERAAQKMQMWRNRREPELRKKV